MAKEPAGMFADLLQRLRAGAGLTQEELAAAATLSPRTVSDLERGINRRARRDTAGLLAGALGLAGPARDEFLAAARGRPVAGPPGAVEAASVTDGEPDELAASSRGWLESAATPYFTGREQELGQLREAWKRAAAGHRVLALVGGEPGIGKTALAGELARVVRAERGLVLFGRWGEHALAPYQAFREALGDYGRACPETVLRRDLDGLAGEVARVCPETAQRLGIAAAGPLAAAEAERFRLFEALDTWIERMGARHPVLLVLDDLQWADRPSVLLLSHLIQARRPTPLLVVAMYRDIAPERSELSGVLHSLSRDADCHRIPLRGLGADAVTALLTAAFSREPAGPEFEPALARELEQDTAGNPFFLLEMARHASAAGIAGQPGPVPAGIPAAVHDMVQWRLQQVSEGCAGVLEIAAVIGERFDAALVAAAAPQPDAVAAGLLDEAVRAGLITEADDEPDYWRFRHPVSYRVLSERLSRGRRAQLHRQIAEKLAARPDAAPAELARHFGAAASIGGAETAVHYERLAARQALAEVAAEVAVGHLRTALRLLDRFGPRDARLRSELLLELAGAHDRAGEYPSRDERYAEAAAAARPLADGALFLRAALGYGGILPATVTPDPRAVALLEEALERAPADSPARATILARLAHWLHSQRPYAERRRLSDQSVAMARAAGDQRTLATVLTHRGWALDGPDDVGDALTVAAEILAIGTRLGDPELRLEGMRIQVAAQFEQGSLAGAAATAADMRLLAQEVGYPEFIRLAAMWDITVANLEGRFADARQQAGDLTRQLTRLGHSQAGLIPLAQVFPWGVLRGGAAQFLPTLRELSAYEPSNIAWPAVTAWCLAESGARDEAAALLEDTDPAAVAAADKNYLWWAVIVGFAGAADLTGDRRWAGHLYDLAAPYAGHNATLGLATFLGAADHWLGALAGAAGRFEEAAGHLEAALARHQEMGARPLTALTQETYGYLLSGRPAAAERERGAALAAAARQTAGELGLAAVAARPRPPRSAR